MRHTPKSIHTMNEYACGCEVRHDSAGCYYIEWCSCHKAAPDLLDACKVAYKATYRPGNPAMMMVHTMLAEAISKAGESAQD